MEGYIGRYTDRQTKSDRRIDKEMDTCKSRITETPANNRGGKRAESLVEVHVPRKLGYFSTRPTSASS